MPALTNGLACVCPSSQLHYVVSRVLASRLAGVVGVGPVAVGTCAVLPGLEFAGTLTPAVVQECSGFSFATPATPPCWATAVSQPRTGRERVCVFERALSRKSAEPNVGVCF